MDSIRPERNGWRRFFNVVLWFFGGAFNIALVALVAIGVYRVTMWGFEQGGNFAYSATTRGYDYAFEFILEEDTPVAEVARMLDEMGVINDHRLFMLERFMTGSVEYYRAGTFNLNFNMTSSELHAELRRRPQERAPHLVITIPEGLTIRQMAEYFEYRGFFTAEEFIYVANYGHFSFGFLRDVPAQGTTGRLYRLEGYLFPDTYFIPVVPTPGCIITPMLRRFDEIFDDDMRALANEMGLTIDEVVIMASIIERETRLASERPLVSQVIHRRLAQGWNLEMCSTVAYVLDVPRDRLLLVDLQIESPFNTYRNRGLPVGPIASPGRAALYAALNPANTTYMFFVLRDPATGAHHFSHTLAEHNAADARYRQD